MKYILEGKTPVECEDLTTWVKWLESADCGVARTEIDGVKISTIFIAVDHGHCEGEPLLFETMVFGGELDAELRRYATWDEAEIGHAEMCLRVREAESVLASEFIG